jgi:uncharacterized protein
MLKIEESVPDVYRLTGKVLDVCSNPTSDDHGPKHWKHVAETGLTIAREFNGLKTKYYVDPTIVFLFALFHDCNRVNDHTDPDHGARGGNLAERLRGSFFDLPNYEMGILVFACEEHTDIRETSDPTTGACWDADRLNLPRVGVECDPYYLHHEYSKREPIRRLWGDNVWAEPPSWEQLWRQAQADREAHKRIVTR